MADVPSFMELFGGRAAEPVRAFDYDPSDGELRVRGYSVDEIKELLAAQREHFRLTLDLLREMQLGADAVRYSPAPADDHEDSLG